jgi:putative oxidoreductase
MKLLNEIKNNGPDLGILLLRLAIGTMMLSHGGPKLIGLLNGQTQFADPIGLGPVVSLGLAVFAEFVCSILIIIGWQFRLAVIPLIVTMLVAVLIVHGEDPWATKEKASLYLLVYLVLLISGSGKYSLVHLLKKK